MVEEVMERAYELAVKRAKFDKIWKITLLILMIIGIGYMFYEFQNINKAGLDCKNNPFQWGEEMALKEGITCTHTCFVPGAFDYSINFSKRNYSE